MKIDAIEIIKQYLVEKRILLPKGEHIWDYNGVTTVLNKPEYIHIDDVVGEDSNTYVIRFKFNKK